MVVLDPNAETAKTQKDNVGRRPVMSLVSNVTRRQAEGVPYECDILENRISYGNVGAGIEVHKRLGPGLLESAYGECLAYELATRGFVVAREVRIPLTYLTVLDDLH